MPVQQAFLLLHLSDLKLVQYLFITATESIPELVNSILQDHKNSHSTCCRQHVSKISFCNIILSDGLIVCTMIRHKINSHFNAFLSRTVLTAIYKASKCEVGLGII